MIAALGVVRGRNFYHEALGIALTAPAQWQVRNTPEAIVLAIARRTGAAVDEPVTHMVDVPGSASQSCYWPQVKAHPRAVEFAR